jgi:hypothetical protein
MTAVPPPEPGEPPPGEAQAEAETWTGKRLLSMMSPRFVWSQAEGYPVVIKQFLQFCLILIYPAWVFGILAMAAIYYVVLLPGYYVLLAIGWVVFWPLRMRQKKKNPEEYEEYRKKYWRR